MSDPSNYRDQQITGNAWRRAYKVTINNPHGGVPTILIDEEEVIAFGVDSIRRPTGLLATNFEPAAQVPLINPANLQPIGQSMSQEQAYLVLFSLYMQLARKRDAELVAAGQTSANATQQYLAA